MGRRKKYIVSEVDSAVTDEFDTEEEVEVEETPDEFEISETEEEAVEEAPAVVVPEPIKEKVKLPAIRINFK